MPQDRYTRDKLKTLKKIYDMYNLPCKISDLRKYEEWVSVNKEELLWKDRWNNMRLYARSILNPNYNWKDISVHGQHIINDRKESCKCKMCKDKYNPKGFPEKSIDNNKILTIEIEKDNIRTPEITVTSKKTIWQRLLQKLRCY